MIDEHLASAVTVVGSLVERPTFSKSEMGEPLAHFHVELGENHVWCLAVGRLAENVQRFGAVGADVIGWGRLDWLSGQPEQPFVHLDRLAFANPAEVAELTGAAW